MPRKGGPGGPRGPVEIKETTLARALRVARRDGGIDSVRVTLKSGTILDLMLAKNGETLPPDDEVESWLSKQKGQNAHQR
jgi:hypothetical protein